MAPFSPIPYPCYTVWLRWAKAAERSFADPSNEKLQALTLVHYNELANCRRRNERIYFSPRVRLKHHGVEVWRALLDFLKIK